MERRNNNNLNRTESDTFKNEKIFNRRRSFIPNDKLTYKIVIERVVKRFLLYYKDSRIGSDDSKIAMQTKEIKNDLSAFRFELSHDIDALDELRTSTVQSMTKFNENLHEHFDFEQIKRQVKSQGIS
jgi:hypothetical protein